MLVEAWEMDRALRGAGIPTESRHPDIKPLAKRDVLRAVLNDIGAVYRLEVIDRDSAPSFWTVRDGNHNSFPLVQISGRNRVKALRKATDTELLDLVRSKKANLAERVEAFFALRASSALSLDELVPWPSYRQRLEERRLQLASLRGTEARAICVLLDRLLAVDGTDILLSLDEVLTHGLREVPSDSFLELAAKLAFMGPGEVLLDIDPNEDAVLRATDPSNIPAVGAALSRSDASGPMGTCALSGANVPVEDDKFPQANLPIIGPTYLFSRNLDIPSTIRYGLGGPASFTVSKKLASDLQSAIEALTAESRRERTWALLPSEQPKQYDLLIAFLPAAEDLAVAGTIAGGTEAASVTGDVFEELTADLLRLAKGIDSPRSPLGQIVVIRKVDAGNRKVVYSTSTGLTTFAEAAARWTDGCHNVPRELIQLPVRVGKNEPAKKVSPWVVSPGRLVALGREMFTRDGTERTQAPGPTFANAMRLFLGEDAARRREAARLLPHFLGRRQRLLSGIAHASHRGQLGRYDTRAALETAALLGLLLQEHRLQRKKEEFMESTAFQLGQLLAGADVLHRGYCEHQRGGDIPPSLLGNQILPLAQRSPVSALAQLSRRWAIYSGWAEKNRRHPRPKGESDKQWAIFRAAHMPRRLQLLAERMKGSIPEKADDVFRAELLLGYLAGPPRSQAQDAAAQSNTPDPNIED